MKIGVHNMSDNILSAYRRLHAQTPKQATTQVLPEAEHWRRWRELTKPRRHKTFESLPAEIQQKLLTVQKVIHRYDPAAKIKLIGSWVHGGWADRHTDAEIVELRKLLKGKTGLSDIDILVENAMPLHKRNIADAAGFALNIMQGKLGSQRGILLPPTPKIVLADNLT
jgi:hypothetical protein